MRKIGIYVQVPFCQTRCTYCNFHTGVVSAGRFAPYVDAVCREIRGHGEFYGAAGIRWAEQSSRIGSQEGARRGLSRDSEREGQAPPLRRVR